MKRTIVAFGLVLLIGATALDARTEGFSLKQVPLKEWTKKDDVKKVVGEKLYDLIDGFADIHMGFAFVDSEHVTLRKGKWELEISVFRTDTPGNAFGLYSCLRDREGESLGLTDEAAYAYGTAVLWRGPYCIQVTDLSEEEAPKQEIVAVCKTLSESLKGRHQRPELVRAFPKERLVDRGLMYFHYRHPFDAIYYTGTENVLLLGSDVFKPTKTEAAYAEYKLAKASQGILALRYSKAEEAAKALKLYGGSIKNDVVSTKDDAPWRVLTLKNGKQTLGYQKGRLLVLAFETAEAPAVRAIVEKIAKKLQPPKKPAKPTAKKR